MEKEVMYLVMETNNGIPYMDTVEESELALFEIKEAAIAEVQRRKQAYTEEENSFTFMPEESSEVEVLFANDLDEDGSYDGSFTIGILEVKVVREVGTMTA